MRCFDPSCIESYKLLARLSTGRLLPYEHSGLLHNHVRQEAIAVIYVLRFGTDIQLGYVQADRY